MGSIVLAKCKICDFKTEFNYGGNKLDFQVNCPVPAINVKTGQLENINYKIEKNNSKYKFYSNKELKGNNENNYTLDNFDLKLNTKNNYCPNCKKYSFDFQVIMLTD
jgi:hypothetical protein|tara:strand:+ start:3312 stop:3632 length:321 start_codon:yes stop_codon:yes gene_type:complete